MGEKTGKSDISWQNKDITSKVLAEAFKGKSFEVYGVKDSEIVKAGPTNLPAIEANELRMDNLFEFKNGSLGIVDYESTYDEENKVKYLSYVARIVRRIYNERKRFVPIRIIIIYTADIERGKTNPILELGGFALRLTEVFLTEFDSEQVWKELEKAVQDDQISDEIMMKFIIYPLTLKGDKAKRECVSQLIDLAVKIKNHNKQVFVLTGIYTFVDKVIDDKDAERIGRILHMTKVGRLLTEEIEQKVEERVQKVEERVQQRVEERVQQEVSKELDQVTNQAGNERAENIAGNLLREGVASDVISRSTGLSAEKIEELKEAVLA